MPPAPAKFGAGYTTIRKPVRTLTALCAEAGLGKIDFLKIDVEGAEAEVLAGMDFALFRPRVVMIEAIAPGSMEAAWSGWEPDLTRAAAIASPSSTISTAATSPRRKPHSRSASRSSRRAWNHVQHLWDCGRAPDQPEHPDHELAKILQSGFFAMLPSLDPGLLRAIVERGLEATKAGPFSPETAAALIGSAEFPRAPSAAPNLAGLLSTDELRAAMGRIACTYDGGHIME